MRITVTGKEKGERSRWGENPLTSWLPFLSGLRETSPHLSNLQGKQINSLWDHEKT